MKRVSAVILTILILSSLSAQEVSTREFETGNAFAVQMDGTDWEAMTYEQKFWLSRGYLMGWYVWAHSFYSNQAEPALVYNTLGSLLYEDEWDLVAYANQYYSLPEHEQVLLIQGLFHASPESKTSLDRR